MSNINLSFLKRDYQSLLGELTSIIPNLTDDWTDFSDGDVCMLLVKLMAAVKDMQAYQFDMQQLENYIPTVKQRANLISIVKPFGYNLRSYRCPQIVVRLDSASEFAQFENGTYIGKEFTVEDGSSALVFTFLGHSGDAIAVTEEGETHYEITLYQGRLVTWPSTIAETSDDIFDNYVDENGNSVSDGKPIAISYENAKVAIDGTSFFVLNDIRLSEFHEESSFVDGISKYAGAEGEMPKMYRLYVDRDNKTYLEIYNKEVEISAVSPTIRLSQSQAHFKFMLTEGTAGIVSSGTILTYNNLLGDAVVTEVLNIKDKGADPETVEEARESIPKFVKTMDRAVSTGDYEYLTEQYLKNVSPTSGYKLIGTCCMDYYRNITTEYTYQSIADFPTDNYKVVMYFLAATRDYLSEDYNNDNAYVNSVNMSDFTVSSSALNTAVISYLNDKRMVGIQLFTNMCGSDAKVKLSRFKVFVKYTSRSVVNIDNIKKALSEAYKLRNDAFATDISVSEILNLIYSADPNIMINVATGIKIVKYDDSTYGDNRSAPSTDSGGSTSDVTSKFNEALIFGGAKFEVVT